MQESARRLGQRLSPQPLIDRDSEPKADTSGGIFSRSASTSVEHAANFRFYRGVGRLVERGRDRAAKAAVDYAKLRQSLGRAARGLYPGSTALH